MGIKIFLPIHLLWINLITDCFPAIALGMEKADPDSMTGLPQRANQSIFAGGMGFDIIWQGLAAALLTLISFALGAPGGELTAMSMAFMTLTTAELAQALNMRSRTRSIFTLRERNPYLAVAIVAAIGLSVMMLYVSAAGYPLQADSLIIRANAYRYRVGSGNDPLSRARQMADEQGDA